MLKIAVAIGYDLLRPTEPLGIIILIIGALFSGMTLYVFINVSQDNDSLADKKQKKLEESEQAKKIARLYPKK